MKTLIKLFIFLLPATLIYAVYQESPFWSLILTILFSSVIFGLFSISGSPDNGIYVYNKCGVSNEN